MLFGLGKKKTAAPNVEAAADALREKMAPVDIDVDWPPVALDIESAADALRELKAKKVQSFIQATERGDAMAAKLLCTDDFLYKTHSATTDSLAAADERFHTKVPAPAKVVQELHEAGTGIFVREIVVKPVPFITVGVRQEFELRGSGDDVRLCRAEYIKR